MMRNVIHAAALAAAGLAGLSPATLSTPVAAQYRQAPTQPDWSWQPTPPPASQPAPQPTWQQGPAGPSDGAWQPDAYSSFGAPERPDTFSSNELLDAGHAFFGETSSGFAQAIESVLTRFGRPNAYILGEEGSGAVVGGLRYGDGTLTTAGMGQTPVYWQGPSLGWDFGGSGSRVMMLVYNLKSPEAVMTRFTGVDGSAYLVGGASVTMMIDEDTYLIPVRTGVGVRLGASIGYLKFTATPTWNPF